MWTRRELKERGKAAFKANRWPCVLVALIMMIIIGAGAGAGSSSITNNMIENNTQVSDDLDIDQYLNNKEYGEDDLDQLLEDIDAMSNNQTSAYSWNPFLFALAGLASGVFLVGLILSIFVINPLQVGCMRFFSENSRAPAQISEIGYGFEKGYGRVVKTMLLTDVFTILWLCLFIVPGIIKAYSYRMVPYILAQEPELSGRDVINRSRQMMNGNKWKAFVLDLSFILWYLLSAITLGLVGIFYVNPYVQATDAELYHALANRGNGTYDGGGNWNGSMNGGNWNAGNANGGANWNGGNPNGSNWSSGNPGGNWNGGANDGNWNNGSADANGSWNSGNTGGSGAWNSGSQSGGYRMDGEEVKKW